MALGNKELQYLHMMLQGVKNKLVVKEQDQGDFVVVVQFWRNFASNFEGKIEVVECGEGEEGWYKATVGGFRLPNQAALDAPLPQGKGNLGALGDPDGKGVKTAPAIVVVDRKKKKTEKPVIIPVKQLASGTFRPQFRKFEDYVIVSDTLEGLGVPSSSSDAGGVTAGTRPLAGQRRKGDTAAAGESKRPAFCHPRVAVLSTRLPATSAGKLFSYLKKLC
ncbi:hypothetical protein HanIR_Chr01g0029451 [Helianthus annuus]|nr:hypothetical protein HanIR_Chr01g0029451 [Helianthus annuus]